MNTVIPANESDQCYCCGRVHRRLFLIDGYWLGRRCAEDYRRYQNDPNRANIVWRGYESQFDKVQRMVRGGVTRHDAEATTQPESGRLLGTGG